MNYLIDRRIEELRRFIDENAFGYKLGTSGKYIYLQAGKDLINEETLDKINDLGLKLISILQPKEIGLTLTLEVNDID